MSNKGLEGNPSGYDSDNEHSSESPRGAHGYQSSLTTPNKSTPFNTASSPHGSQETALGQLHLTGGVSLENTPRGLRDREHCAPQTNGRNLYFNEIPSDSDDSMETHSDRHIGDIADSPCESGQPLHQRSSPFGKRKPEEDGSHTKIYSSHQSGSSSGIETFKAPIHIDKDGALFNSKTHSLNVDENNANEPWNYSYPSHFQSVGVGDYSGSDKQFNHNSNFGNHTEETLDSLILSKRDYDKYPYVWLISKNWWKRVINEEPSQQSESESLEIDNSNICDSTGMPIRTLDDDEFVCVTETGWAQLHSMYGGGPAFKMKPDTFGKFEWGFKKLLAKNHDTSQTFTLHIHEFWTVQATFEKVCKEFDVNPIDYSCKVTNSESTSIYNHCEDPNDLISRGVCNGDVFLIFSKNITFPWNTQKHSSIPSPVEPLKITYYNGNSYGKETKTPGRNGLTNSGNNCYLNSSIQCLSHLDPLRNFFLEKKYVSDVNASNILGTGGKLSHAFYDLLTSLWNGSDSSVSPNSFKDVFTSHAILFEGNQQHDAQEFLSALLDGLHEDLNRIQQKPVTEKVEKGSMTDEEAAKLSWETHLKRNDSFIVDNFFGLLKSRIICPKCSKVSVTFDPFATLTVPVGDNINFVLKLTYIPRTGPKTKLALNISKTSTTKDILHELSSRIGANPKRLILAEFTTSQLQRIFDISAILSELITDRDDIFAVEACDDIDYDDPNIFFVQIASATNFKNSYSDFNLIGEPIFVPFTFGTFSLENLTRYVDTEFKPYIDYYNKRKYNHTSQFISAYDWCPSDAMCRLYQSDNPSCYNQTTATPIFSDEDLVGNPRFIFCAWCDSVSDQFRFSTEKRETFEDISYRESSGPQSISLEKTFQLFSEEEQLDDHNAWYCPECKEHHRAHKKLDLWSVPDTLIIHLKRFYFNHDVREKIDTIVDIPMEDFDISQFVIGPRNPQDNLKYNLRGVVCHTGTLNYGHYIAKVKTGPSKWHTFDDSYVHEIYYPDFSKPDSYILFYERQKPQSAAAPTPSLNPFDEPPHPIDVPTAENIPTPASTPVPIAVPANPFDLAEAQEQSGVAKGDDVHTF